MRKENVTTTELHETLVNGDAWTRIRKELEARAEARAEAGTKIFVIDNIMTLTADN